MTSISGSKCYDKTWLHLGKFEFELGKNEGILNGVSTVYSTCAALDLDSKGFFSALVSLANWQTKIA